MKRNGIKLRATGLLSPYKVPCPLYRKTFPVSVGDSSFSELPPYLPPCPLQRGLRSGSARRTNGPRAAQTLCIFTANCLRCSTSARAGRLSGFSERKGLTAAKIHRWLGNNGTPCVDSQPPPLSPFLFAPSDHSCRLQFVLSALAREHRGDLTNIGRAACQKGEKDGGGNARNVVIAAISRNEEEGGERKNNLENGNRKAVRRAVRSKQTRISRASSFDVCVRCSSLAAGHAGTIAGK